MSDAAARPGAQILVTGADGFLGRRLVQRLVDSGAKTRVLVRRPDSSWTRDSRVETTIGDLADAAAVERAVCGVETVIHSGAATRGAAADFQAGTVVGTQNVIAACEAQRIKRLVYVSSLSVIDHAGCDRSRPVTEDAPLEPKPALRGLYTQTKLAAERLVSAATAAGRISAVIIRPGQIIGPGTQWVAPNGVIALGRRWLVVGDGRFSLPLVYVDDVVDALMLAAARPAAAGKIIHVVERSGLTQRDYLERIGASNLGLTVIYVPERLLSAIGWCAEAVQLLLRRELPLSRYRVRSIKPLAAVDVGRAEQVLGWTPRIGVREGLERMRTAGD